MKILLAFCINLLIFNLVYAEVSRNDLVSYTLDFYAGEEKSPEKKIIQQEEKFLPEDFPESKPQKLTQMKSVQKKAQIRVLTRKQTIKRVLNKKSEKINKAILPSQQKGKLYGTKLSFVKSPDKSKEKEPAANKKEFKKEIKEKKPEETKAEKPNYIKGVLKNTHPYVMGIGEFNDNIYHAKGNTRYDYITKLYPGFEIKSNARQKKFDAYLNTGAEILRYAKTPENDRDSPFAKGFIKYNLGRVGLITSASSNHIRSTPADLGDAEASEFIDYWRYNMGQDFQISFNRFDIALQYNRDLYGYDEEDFKSSNHARDAIALRNSIKIFPKTKLFVEYAHAWVNYHKDTSQNYDYDRPVVGFNGQILRKLNGTVKVGYNFNKMKTGKNLTGGIFNAVLTYKASNRLNYDLNLVKGLGSIDLITEGVTKYKGVFLGCSYLPPFFKKLRLNGNVGLWQTGSDYQTRDKYWTASFRPEYKFKDWLMFGLGYTFQNRGSKSQANDYRNNRIEMSVMSEF